MDLEMLKERARIIREVRSFFDQRNYLELDTPVLSPFLIPESCLEVFMTERYPSGRAEKARAQQYWLVPSPEVWMKRIISQHRVSVYQVCKCFRNGEAGGFLHNSEFTMLEYYTTGAGYMDSLAITEELFSFISRGGPLSLPFLRITVAEAFERWAGIDLFSASQSRETMESAARSLGIMAEGDIAAIYDLIFIHAVEPNLKTDRPVALLDYPAFVPCLAKKSGDGKTVERWELYYNGIELANCYSEETDPGAVREFFISEGRAKEQSAVVKHAVDHDYWKIFKGFPRCSGVAMGLDRLIMAVTGRKTIDGVLPFPGY